MANFNASQFNARIRAAQRREEQQLRLEIDRVNRANQRAVNDFNRKVDAHNKREIDRVNRANQKVVDDHNRQVAAANRKADAHNKRVIDDLNRRLQQGSATVRYTEPERVWRSASMTQSPTSTQGSTTRSSVAPDSTATRSPSSCATPSRPGGWPFGSTTWPSSRERARRCRWTKGSGRHDRGSPYLHRPT